MRFALSVALLAVPVAAFAEDDPATSLPHVGDTTRAVIGGSPAPAGKWPDAVALRESGSQFCTGTLIAPTVVVTAGHCVLGSTIDDVLVGATALSRTSEGEVIRVSKATEYPDSQSTIDAAVLVLATPATTAPRAIATGWARFDVKNGAPVALVGYGTTDRDGTVPTDALLEATTTITDASCTASAGCNVKARPDGELGAGGMGIDTCPGDSGGPVYLTTPYGDFLVGITSRGYDNNQYYCSEGGIYARADKIVRWVEETTGVTLTHGPEPTAEPITTVRGVGAETTIAPNDPAGGMHTYAIVTQPQYGTAAVNADGVVRVCPRKDVVGGDSVVVSVTDQSNPTRTVNAVVGVTITDGSPDDDCDPNDFGDGGGCCDTRRSASGSIPLALGVLLLLRRRRPAR